MKMAECTHCNFLQKINYKIIDDHFRINGNTSNFNYKHNCEKCKKEFIIKFTVA